MRVYEKVSRPAAGGEDGLGGGDGMRNRQAWLRSGIGSEHPPTDKDPMRSVERFQDFLAALAPPKTQKRRLRRR